MRSLATRLSYANVVATIALVVAVTTGVAYAATIGSSQIIDNSIRSKDVRDGALLSRDIGNGSLVAADLSSATRASYTDTSPWEVIPSGETITGSFYWDLSTPTGAIADFRFAVDLGAVAPVPLVAGNINFAPDVSAATLDDDATCTGGVYAPTAPAGKVCVYLGSADLGTTDLGAYDGNLNTRTFVVRWFDNGASSDVYVQGTWAYTAP